MSLCSVVIYVCTPVVVLLDLQAPPPNTYRGLYCDPEKAGELYAEEIKKLIDEAHSKGNKVCICNMCMCGCVNLIYHDHQMLICTADILTWITFVIIMQGYPHTDFQNLYCVSYLADQKMSYLTV